MSVDFNKKIEDINIFLNDMYYPLLQRYGLTKDELIDITQKIVNKLDSMKDRLDEIDTEDYRSLVNLATNGGIVYKDDNGTQFEDINEAFINSTIGSMKALCDKNGVEMSDYSLGNPNVLPTIAEEKVSKMYLEDFKMFFKGDALGFYNKYSVGPNIKQENDTKEATKDILEQLRESLLQSKQPETTSVKKIS